MIVRVGIGVGDEVSEAVRVGFKVVEADGVDEGCIVAVKVGSVFVMRGVEAGAKVGVVDAERATVGGEELALAVGLV